MEITRTELAEIEYCDVDGDECEPDYIYWAGLRSEAQDAWLQYCLQEAVRARGWGYHIRISRGHEIVSTIIGTGKRASDYFSEEGSTEVEALLRAYLAAIQEAA